MTDNVFAKYEQEAYPFKYRAVLLVHDIAGGVPSDPKVIEGYIRSKVEDTDDRIRKLIAETMAERELKYEDAIQAVVEDTNVNGFKSDETGLYIDGRQLKACLKEAASIAVAAGKIPQAGYGKASKQGKFLTKFLPEHVFVREERLSLGVERPTETVNTFGHVRTPQGNRSIIKSFDTVREAKVEAHIDTDWELPERTWAMLWLTAGQNGLGADRSMGYGVFDVVIWERES